MRHDFIYITLSIILVSFGFNSCRAKKNIERNSEVTERIERTERSVDSIRFAEKQDEKTERIGLTADQWYVKHTEFDSIGRVRSVSETWRNRRHSDMASEERTGRTVSVIVSGNEVIETDTSSIITQEYSNIQTDSRPVQGLEWFWVISSGVLILSIVIYLLFNKNEKWL